MELTKEHTEQIEGIMSSMDCQKDFKCYKSDFDSICRAVHRGLDTLADCCDHGNTACAFRVPFGRGAFCRCPLRIYIAKHFKK
ncbi:MAG: hypothetical protein JSW66_09270 [Phycisphaerales bacterium]|nr:MAG: hypothetical protein JSW66_09270 [Phycisphaerales bacterium]